jgi:hypothetical protein
MDDAMSNNKKSVLIPVCDKWIVCWINGKFSNTL